MVICASVVIYLLVATCLLVAATCLLVATCPLVAILRVIDPGGATCPWEDFWEPMLAFSLAIAQVGRDRSHSYCTLGDTRGQEDAPDDCTHHTNHCDGDSKCEDSEHEQPMGVQELAHNVPPHDV